MGDCYMYTVSGNAQLLLVESEVNIYGASY